MHFFCFFRNSYGSHSSIPKSIRDFRKLFSLFENFTVKYQKDILNHRILKIQNKIKNQVETLARSPDHINSMRTSI